MNIPVIRYPVIGEILVQTGSEVRGGYGSMPASPLHGHHQRAEGPRSDAEILQKGRP